MNRRDWLWQVMSVSGLYVAVAGFAAGCDVTGFCCAPARVTSMSAIDK